MSEERRLELHQILCDLLGSSNVYFQPPETVRMNYPAIVYSLNSIENRHANNRVYSSIPSYTLILITEDPDDPLIHRLARLTFCSFDRFYTADNLNHYAYTLYY